MMRDAIAMIPGERLMLSSPPLHGHPKEFQDHKDRHHLSDQHKPVGKSACFHRQRFTNSHDTATTRNTGITTYCTKSFQSVGPG